VPGLLVFDALTSMAAECVFKFTPKAQRFAQASLMYKGMFNRLELTRGAEANKMLHKKLLAFAFDYQDRLGLYSLLKNDLKFETNYFGISDLWSIVMKTHKICDQNGQKVVEANGEEVGDVALRMVQKKDQSDLAKYAKLFTQSMGADLTERRAIWDSVVNPKSTISFGDLEYILGGMFSLLVADAHKQPLWDLYFDALPDVIRNHSKTYARTFLTTCLPDTDDVDPVIASLAKVLSGLSEKDEYFQILIRKSICALERKKKVLALAKTRLKE
jgi:hypothetical protein